MKIHKIGFGLVLAAALQAEPYTLGQGIHFNEMLNVGGYFSSEFQSKNSQESATIEDVAVLAYGEINPMLSYMAEAEAVGFYTRNLSTGMESGSQKFHIERLYGDLWMSDDFNVRFGKQITPIGYWNKEPINVLRDTTSNPLYEMLLFPRFLTGIDINGYIPKTEGMKYHLFGQNNHDLDEEYINIPNTHFFGLSLEKEFSPDWNGGGSLGEYITLSHQRTRFVQVNAKYDDSLWQIMAEALAARSEYGEATNAYAVSGYFQGMYRYTPQHAFLSRLEYFNDQHTRYQDSVGIIGYSYRPLYPVSFKGEYQWHSQSGENRVLLSFSVLF